MVDLGKFTQVRPANFGNVLQLAKRHIPILSPNQTISFHSKDDSFAKIRETARKYLAEKSTRNRIDIITDWLLDPQGSPATQGTQLNNWPDRDLLLCAETFSWLPGTPVLDEAALGPLKDYTTSPSKLEFDVKIRLDLLALFINPGLYPDYRRFLASLLKLCSIVMEDPKPLNGFAKDVIFPEDSVEEEEKKGQIILGSRLDKFMRARLLFPPLLRADPHPGYPDEGGTITSATGDITSGQILVQADELLQAEAMLEVGLKRPKIPAISVALTEPGKESKLLDRKPETIKDIKSLGGGATQQVNKIKIPATPATPKKRER